ncbi:MAG: exodeoxyribonuclease VII large subunit [Methylobacteriaceae bacterium]|nr:exodeoxyribonuclease VII large subunit [Methylobacteriaceae bacterium]
MAYDDSKTPPASNVPELTVSELSGRIRGTLEDAFGYIRLRGEVSGYRGPHSSGHVYFSLKDVNARIDAVIWRTTFSRLKFKPADGMEVIATGRVSAFPGKSSYQIVIENLEPAGAGALMALLAERRKKFEAEGLFAAEHKLKIPFLPGVIGVVTSPTGAVVRDILHRLNDRFPRRVLVWPVRVQGETSAREVADAIRGFNALEPGGPVPRPDVLIVARGGGSVEDLWSFNEEEVVRAAYDSRIPLISAIGHETDWTLLDLAADMRAPTPTGAAEFAVPVRSELVSSLHSLVLRRENAWTREHRRRVKDLSALVRVLPTADTLFAGQRQTLDFLAAQMLPALRFTVARAEKHLHDVQNRLAAQSPRARLAAMRARFSAVAGRPQAAARRNLTLAGNEVRQWNERLIAARRSLIRQHKEKLARQADGLGALSRRLTDAFTHSVQRRDQRLNAVSQLFASMNYKAVLRRGYALVRDTAGQPVSSVSRVKGGAEVQVEVSDGVFAAVVATPSTARPAMPADSGARRKPPRPSGQGDLFGS